MADGDYNGKTDLENSLVSGSDDQDSDYSLLSPSISPSPKDKTTAEKDLELKEVTELGEKTVDEVISLAEKANELKEHDVKEEEDKEAERVQSELDKELEENDGWVKILGNEELMKKVIKEGEAHNRPIRGDICTVRYEGRLGDDESVVFEKDDAFQFQLGDAEVIPGLDLSVPLMTKGELATLKIAHRFAYGSKGLPPLVPPSANVVYELELTNFETEKDLSELTVEQRREIGNRKRERGNWWYGRNEASLAVQSYRRALEFLDEVEGGIQFPSGDRSDKITPEVRALFEDRLKTLNNMAAAQLKLQAFEPALNSVEAVLKCQPNNVKALFRKGKILGEKGDTEKAIQTLQRAKVLQPEDKSITVEINRLSQRRKKETQKEKQLYQRMFNKDSSNDSANDSIDESSRGNSSFKSALSFGIVLSGVAIAVAGVMAYRYRF